METCMMPSNTEEALDRFSFGLIDLKTSADRKALLVNSQEIYILAACKAYT